MRASRSHLSRSLRAAWASVFVASVLLQVGVGEAADIKERSLKFSLASPQGQAPAFGAQKFAELVGQKSGGKITVRVFPGGVLGGDAVAISALQGGTLDLTVLATGLLVGHVKDYLIFDFPFVFRDAKEADAVVDGPIGKKLSDKLLEKGLIELAYWDLGFRVLSNSRRPVTKWEDIQGLKIRVLQVSIYIDLFNALGANAVPMPFPELYTAMETRTVDGQENPANGILFAKFNEVQKYLSLTRHTYNAMALLVSKKLWDQLSSDEQKILQDAANEAREYQRKVSREQDPEAIETLKKSGMQVNEISASELTRMQEKTKPVVDKYTKEVGEALVKELYAEIEKARARK
jgi:TRAP-type transport system periplasmic protein